MSDDNINRVGFACRAISEALQEVVKGTKTYDLRMPIEKITVALDERNPRLTIVNIECTGTPNQAFNVLVEDEK